MIYSSAEQWQNAPHKRVVLFGMSGLGKTYMSNILRDTGSWFHYSVDYRIGTHYMGDYITDSIKRKAMDVPYLRELLLSDSIYLASNITFENLAPLSTYMGKPGAEANGGVPFQEYRKRQEQHLSAVPKIYINMIILSAIAAAQSAKLLTHLIAMTLC